MTATDDQPDDTATGWEAINAAVAILYGDQEPKHYGTLLRWSLGGPDPLDGISAWKRLEPVPHWHFVTYGLSELYAKESDNAEESGYGFELTLRVACDPTDVDPPVWAFGLLQNLARYVFQSGNVFRDGHWMPANGPLGVGQETQICSMAFLFDPELPAIDTPNGHLAFIQVVGITVGEELAAKRWQTRRLLEALLPAMPLWVTDLARGALLDHPDIREQIEVGTGRDGSSTSFVHTDVLGWAQQKRLLRPAITEIALGARQVAELLALLPFRLPFGRSFTVIGRGAVLVFQPGDVNAMTQTDGELRLTLTAEVARALMQTLQPRAGSYDMPGFETVRWKVEKTLIRDAEGKNVVATIG